MIKNIILFVYIIIIGIALTVVIFSNHVTETGIIEINDKALITVEGNMLKPKIVEGDLVIVNTKDKKVKEDDIISYVTLEEEETTIRTNKVVAITKDSKEEKIYSLKKEDGGIENIDDSCIIGTQESSLPFIGKILNYLMTTEGFLTITLYPTVIILIGYIISFLLSLRKPRKA